MSNLQTSSHKGRYFQHGPEKGWEKLSTMATRPQHFAIAGSLIHEPGSPILQSMMCSVSPIGFFSFVGAVSL